MISREGLAVRFHEDGLRPMGRATSGVRGMNVAGKDNAVLAMDIARDEQEVLVVTENGFGKRTAVSEYRKTSRGAKGVQTIKFSEKRGGLAAALVVRPHEELVFISENGMVQRTGVAGIRQTGRAAQGVTVMNVRDDDRVSAVALIVESDDDATAAKVAPEEAAAGPATAGVRAETLSRSSAVRRRRRGPSCATTTATSRQRYHGNRRAVAEHPALRHLLGRHRREPHDAVGSLLRRRGAADVPMSVATQPGHTTLMLTRAVAQLRGEHPRHRVERRLADAVARRAGTHVGSGPCRMSG